MAVRHITVAAMTIRKIGEFRLILIRYGMQRTLNPEVGRSKWRFPRPFRQKIGALSIVRPLTVAESFDPLGVPCYVLVRFRSPSDYQFACPRPRGGVFSPPVARRRVSRRNAMKSFPHSLTAVVTNRTGWLVLI